MPSTVWHHFALCFALWNLLLKRILIGCRKHPSNQKQGHKRQGIEQAVHTFKKWTEKHCQFFCGVFAWHALVYDKYVIVIQFLLQQDLPPWPCHLSSEGYCDISWGGVDHEAVVPSVVELPRSLAFKSWAPGRRWTVWEGAVTHVPVAPESTPLLLGATSCHKTQLVSWSAWFFTMTVR